MKKNILVFGGNSYITTTFIQKFGNVYNIVPVYRNNPEKQLNFDFITSSNYISFAEKITFPIDAVLFLQGINPSQGIDEITEAHFLNMIKINLVTPVLLLRSLKKKLAHNCSVIFFSSIAKKKGSYDPSYAAAKSGLVGLMHSLANAFVEQRFNIISLGLVENSPVFNQMTEDFRVRHANRMQGSNFVKAENVASVIELIINNSNINRSDIPIDGGYN